MASDLCPRDRREPEGQVSSLKGAPFRNLSSDFVWGNKWLRKTGPEDRDSSAQQRARPVARGPGPSPGHFASSSCLYLARPLHPIRDRAETRPSLPGPGTTALWHSLPPEAPLGCRCFLEGHPGPRRAPLSPTATPAGHRCTRCTPQLWLPDRLCPLKMPHSLCSCPACTCCVSFRL